MAERQLAQHDERADRHDRGERLAGLLHLRLELAAALAGLEVAARRRRRPADQALGDLAQLAAHLLAGEQARFGGLSE